MGEGIVLKNSILIKPLIARALTKYLRKKGVPIQLEIDNISLVEDGKNGVKFDVTLHGNVSAKSLDQMISKIA